MALRRGGRLRGEPGLDEPGLGEPGLSESGLGKSGLAEPELGFRLRVVDFTYYPSP